MGKKKKRLKQLTAGIVIGAITISTIIGTMFAANSIKPEEATTSVAVFEDLLNNRSFVIDTFTKDAMPDSNPYGKLDGVGNIDYLSKDFLDNYKNDSKFGSAVDLYYRMNHEGETFSEIPSALLDVFANEADWTKFCQGAKSKSYDSLLTSIYQNDYKSVSGKSVGNEENSMQTLRTYSEKLGVVKDADEFIKEYFGDLYSDVNEIDEYNYLRQKTKLFDDNLETYVTNVNKVLIDGALKSDNTKTAKDFSSLYEAKYYADYGREGAPSIWNERYVAMNVEKNTKYLKKVTSAVKNIVGTGISTVNNIIMMENLYRNQESMHDTLVRVRNNAKKNNDNTFIRASSTYLKMLESDDLGDNVILNSGLKAIYDYSTTELNKFIWDKTKEGIRDEAASIVATQTGMDTLASQMAVSSTVARTNAILAVGEALTKYGTGFDDVCEKIYLMKYLQEIKEYAVEAFNTDKDNYQKYKNESNMKEMDNYASAAIDDLQFLKRIVLLQNQLGYKTADAQVGSIAGKIISWIKGCESANDLEARYTNLQNALVDTAINPISINPFSIDEGCTLKVIHSTDSELQTYAVYTNKEGKKCSIAEFDKVLLAGIKINGGTLNISDQADRDIVMNSLFVTNNGGSLQITGNGGDIHVGRFDINGSFNKPEKCTKKLIVEGNCNVISSCSLENLDLDIEGDCNVDDYAVLAFGGSNVTVDGDMNCNSGHLHMVNESDTLRVNGSLMLGEGYGTNSEHEMTAGTVEVKGDFTSKYKRDNSPYGYYETANHKTVFSGDKTQKISFVESSEVNQFNGNLELKNPEINFATPIYSLTVNNDMNITKTDNLEIKTILNLEKGSLVTNGNVHAKTMNIESRKNNIKGNLQVEGNVSFGEGSLTIDGNTEITQGNLHMKNDSDNLLVKGNLILGEDYGTNSEYEMTEGTVEVKGDFTSKYKRDYRSYGYYETLNHKTIFSGDKTQKISFTQACNVNGFNENLELENNDINFATSIYDVKINQDTELTNTKELVVIGTLDSGDYKFTTTGNVEAERFNTRGKEVDIEGNVKAGILYIAGDNNQIHGNLKTTDSVIFSEGSLSIAGDTEIEKGHLYMTNDSDKLLVKGNLILGEDYGTNSEHEMTAGTVEVKGDFTSKYKRDYRPYGYYETGNHATIFSGGKTQKISFAEPSEVNQFNGNLELKNSDINFATPIYSLSLNQDTTLIHTDTLNVTDTLKLNGNKLLTTGKVNYGRLSGNGGTLEENPKLGHNYYKQLQPADPKEYDTKYADEIWVCKSCGKIFTDAEGTKEYDPDTCKNGHTIVVDEGKKETCITEGLTEGEHCKVCKKIIVAQKKIPATGHKYSEWITTKENTCTEEGITQRKCGICGFTESKKLDKKAHEWDTDFTVDKKATFQADGSKSKHCKNCDAVYGLTVIPRVNEMKLSAVTYSYTGGVKTPSVTVKDAKGKTLKNNVDYTIKYASGRKNVGTYSVIMTLKGNYSTSKTMKFIINPKGTSISKLSKAKKSFTVKWKKQNTQTTGYRLIYSMNSKFKTGNKYVMITSNKTISKSIKKLKAKKKYYIRICTYKTVGGTKYYSGWSSVKSVTTK